jgi:hypothetical protein
MSIQQVTATHDQIAARAYAIWEREGYLKDRHLVHWLEAERQLHRDTESAGKREADVASGT